MEFRGAATKVRAMDIPAAIRYLRECYREDVVRGGYWDLFGR